MNTPPRGEIGQPLAERIDLLGRVSVVTGATRGLGLATSISLARMGARVIMLARDRGRGEEAAQQVRMAAAPGADAELVVMDLASLSSVRAAAAEIASRYDAVHVLINNAGVHLRRRATSADGFELTWAINHLGPFLFTRELLPRLRAAEDARIVNVTSVFARFGRVIPSRIGTAHASSGLRAYLDTKLANMLFTIELARLLQGTSVTANSVDPGLVATDLMREWPRWMRRSWEWGLRTLESGAAPIVRLASSPSVTGVSGRHFVRARVARSPRRARDRRLAEELWAESERLVQAGQGESAKGQGSGQGLSRS
ncbi:MAG TPA: SDR family oxidoreductase [Gemmatimonadaceae bacterium]|nr:SDR family oxidoreductase [Gemmatimonadaceae bacterium]